jgi:uncharacterized protein
VRPDNVFNAATIVAPRWDFPQREGAMKKAYPHVMATLAASLSLPGAASADNPLIELKWTQLTAPLEAVSQLKPKTVVSSSATSADEDAAPPLPLPEGRWMSIKRRQLGADQPSRVVKELNGKRVRIGGYAVPLDFEATTVKEFLLVPYVGACIHVPPPPADQIIYVKTEKGFAIGSPEDAITVTGTIRTDTAVTGVADAGYSLDAESVELLKLR